MEALLNRSIRRLSPETASRIAAGEVIERPLSALKEVVENALDAGARAIEVRIEGTLDASFQVADDGIGIAAGDLELALERHATSKITRLEDLDRLASLGFRGEALPSIAAVSRLRITSRPRESAAAAFVSLEAGAVIDRGDAARAPGTTVEVAELFFNTPARRKFLHSPTGERRAAVRMLECYALAFPEVAFRLVVDGRTRFDWPASRNTRAGEGANGAPSGAVPPDPAACRERATALWGVRHAEQLLEVSAERDGVRLDALLGLPEHGRATREGQVFLVNRRWIQSPMLGQALRNAYGNLLATGRFPSATLWLTVPPERLDVNVHPTKREVRLADEGTVFALVAGACAQVLTHLHPPFTVVRGGQTAEPRWAERIAEPPPDQTYLGFENAPRASGAEPGLDSPPPPTGLPLRPASEAIADVGEPELWQLHRTYILAPLRNGLVLIDQHAAHERVLYEAARARLEGERGAAQQLLFPAIIDLSRSQFELLLELGPWLKQLGWDLAPLGPPSVVVHGVPADVQQRPAGEMLQDVLDGVSESSGRTASEDISEHLARSYACHAAVRAGDPLTQAEMKALVDRLFATSRPHGDPHGRVTYVRIEMDELHRRFGRS